MAAGMTAPAYLTPAYYRTVKTAERAWPEREPAPDVTNRDGVLAPFAYPRAVVDLERAARAAGWEIRTGYSRGQVRSVKIGTYRHLDVIGVHGMHPESGWRFVANYARKTTGGSWEWLTISVWKLGVRTRWTYATVTDLKEFVAVSGAVGTAWFKAVEARVLDAQERARIANRTRARQGREGSS